MVGSNRGNNTESNRLFYGYTHTHIHINTPLNIIQTISELQRGWSPTHPLHTHSHTHTQHDNNVVELKSDHTIWLISVKSCARMDLSLCLLGWMAADSSPGHSKVYRLIRYIKLYLLRLSYTNFRIKLNYLSKI